MPELPAALPPAERTVGQVIAESIRAYSHDFWRLVPLGIPLALADQASIRQSTGVQILVFWAATPLFVAAYVRACWLVLGARPNAVALVAGLLVWLPFPALRAAFILPGLAWLAFLGLAVPAAMQERLSFRDALVRGRELGTADYVHALGSLAALVVVVGVADSVLSGLLNSQGDTDQRVALALSDLVLSPLLVIGGALLYVDQAARAVRSARDAPLHPALDADAAGGPDPQVES